MLLAASESAVTKKPRLRLTMRRSSSVRPLGSFQSAMSRLMFTSCGIQWLAQVARYFSQAHLYLNGTSWLTSVLPLMMRLSAALTRCWRAAPESGAMGGGGASVAEEGGRKPERGKDGGADSTERFFCRPPSNDVCDVEVTSSSQVSMVFPVFGLWKQRCKMKSACALRCEFLLLEYTCEAAFSARLARRFTDRPHTMDRRWRRSACQWLARCPPHRLAMPLVRPLRRHRARTTQR